MRSLIWAFVARGCEKGSFITLWDTNGKVHFPLCRGTNVSFVKGSSKFGKLYLESVMSFQMYGKFSGTARAKDELNKNQTVR